MFEGEAEEEEEEEESRMVPQVSCRVRSEFDTDGVVLAHMFEFIQTHVKR